MPTELFENGKVLFSGQLNDVIPSSCLVKIKEQNFLLLPESRVERNPDVDSLSLSTIQP